MVAYATMALSYAITGSVVLVKVAEGKYNYILMKI